MRFLRNTEFGPLVGLEFFSGTTRMKEMLKRQRARRKAEKNRRERLKLGRHLLKDLGFNSKGYPLASDCHEKDRPAATGDGSIQLSEGGCH
jgi:hypothetical protein